MVEIANEEETLADLLHRLGDVSPDRIMVHPPPGTATEDDVIRFLEKPRKRICELMDGVLVEKVMGFREGMFGLWIGHAILSFLQAEDLGLVFGADSPIRFGIGLVRIPDVSFIAWDRMPHEEMPNENIGSVIPNLAIEVLSASNSVREIELKLDHYFEAGVEMAWVIDPKTQTADVYSSRREVKHLEADGTTDGGKVLPGFKLSLAELFALGKRKKNGST